MALSTHIPAQRGWFSNRLNSTFDSFKTSFAKYRVFHTTLNEMSALSDRELGDLGLHRSELRRLAYQAAYEQH